MDTLTEAMHTAADAAPTSLAPEASAAAAWRRGRRRRLATWVGTAGTVLALLLLVVGVALAPLGLPRAAVPAGDPSRHGVTAYPQRLGHQWWVRDLPASGAPVAGAVEVVEGDVPGFQVFAADGTRYRLPGGAAPGDWPAVSPDGTHVGYLPAGDGAAYRVLDLGTGQATGYPQVGTANGALDGGGFVGGRRYGVGGQYPSFFSPDGVRLAVTGFGPGGWNGVLVLEEGRPTEVPGMDMAGGWLDDDRLLGRRVGEGSNRLDGLDLVVWDRRTGRTQPLGTLSLAAPAGSVDEVHGQWWGTVRGDDTLWVAFDEHTQDPQGPFDSRSGTAGWRLPDLTPVDLDGRPLARQQPTWLETTPDFGLEWAGDRPAARGGHALLRAASDGGGPLVVAEDSLTTGSVVWARDALDGRPTWSPFGTSTWLVAWWWKEAALGVLVLVAWWAWWRRRLTRPRRARGSAATTRSAGGR
ncbi:MAG: hypothetical protein IE926_10495 [Micrococcales bacterium]|nr:hypothetical protein [Micrococcales bacterium]